MLAVLLLPWVISSSAADKQCPRNTCRYTNYTSAICCGNLEENFASLTDARLLDLTLEATNITEIACDTFPEGIKKLVLRQNRELRSISFDCIHRVRHLEISAGQLSRVFPITDKNLGSLINSTYPVLPFLKTLYISRLQINNNLDVLLQFFRNVTELHLNQANINYLVNISPELPNVEILDLSNNPIRNISMDFFRSMKKLTTLHLGWTKLTNLSRDIFYPLDNLTFLRLDGNNFTLLEDDIFSTLTKLQKLRISTNQVNSFQSALTRNLKNLKELYLNDNELSALDEHVFDSLKNLRILNLTQNFLTSVPKMVFKNQQKLQKLYLGWNQLEKLEAATLSPLQNLQALFLERNQLTFLEHATFEKLTSLKYLDLNRNMLREMSGVQFFSGTMLQKLFLQWNSLVSIDSVTFRPLKKLEVLRLDGNEFQNLNVDVFEQLDNLRYLNLSECHMLECDCKLKHLWESLKPRNITLADKSLCYDNNTGIHWSHLNKCLSEGSKTANTNVVVLFIILILLLSILAFPVVTHLLQSEKMAWCPLRKAAIDNYVAGQRYQVPIEEDYDYALAGRKASYSFSRQSDYIEPTVPKIILPICVSKISTEEKKPKVSFFSPHIPSSSVMCTVPKGRAPAKPPEY